MNESHPTRLFSLHAGQTGLLLFNITAPEGADTTLRGAVLVAGNSVPMVPGNSAAELLIPPLAAGTYLLEVRSGGATVLCGELDVLQSPLHLEPGQASWAVDADLTQPLAQVNVSFLGGPKGDPGNPGLTEAEHSLLTAAANGALWVPGRTGSVTLTGQGGDGAALSSADSMGRVEARPGGVTITARRTPQWLEAGDTPAFFDIRTSKDLTATDTSLAAALASKQDALPSVSVKQHYADYLSDFNAGRPVIRPTGSLPVPDSGWRYIVLPGSFNNGGLISGVTFTNNAMLRKYAWLAVFQQPEGGTTEPDATWQMLGASREDVMTSGLNTPLTWEFDPPLQATPGRMLCIGVYYTKPTAWTKPDGILVTTYASSGSGGGGWGTADAYNSNSAAYCMPLATLIYSGVDFGQTVKSHLESPYCHLSRSQFAAMAKLLPAAPSPVQNSAAAITAGGVYTALGNKAALSYATGAPAQGGSGIVTENMLWSCLYQLWEAVQLKEGKTAPASDSYGAILPPSKG